MCCRKPKCNWCNTRNKELFKIDIFCKWKGLNICIDCYNNKLNGLSPKYPQYR